MRTRLTERDLSRIVKRVINEKREDPYWLGKGSGWSKEKGDSVMNDMLKKDEKTFDDWTKEFAKRTQEIADNMVYKVKPGDTLSGIAKKRGTTVDKILRDNPAIKDMNKIFVDQVIIVR